MENLLSLSFDYLSSSDGVKIRKGLRQLEGLLAQLCLSRTTTAAERRRSVASDGVSKSGPKDLVSLCDDPAFREFFKLQEGFEWNGTGLLRLQVQLQYKSDRRISGYKTHLLPRARPWKGQQRPKRSPPCLHPRSSPWHSPYPPSLTLPLRSRHLHEPPSRPP